MCTEDLSLSFVLPRLPYGDVDQQSKRQCVLNPYLIAFLQLFGELNFSEHGIVDIIMNVSVQKMK